MSHLTETSPVELVGGPFDGEVVRVSPLANLFYITINGRFSYQWDGVLREIPCMVYGGEIGA